MFNKRKQLTIEFIKFSKLLQEWNRPRNKRLSMVCNSTVHHRFSLFIVFALTLDGPFFPFGEHFCYTFILIVTHMKVSRV